MQSINSPARKTKDTILREFAQTLSDDDLKWALDRLRLSRRFGGDLGEVLEALQGNPELDRLFASARDADGIYDLAEEITRFLNGVCARRSLVRVTPRSAQVA